MRIAVLVKVEHESHDAARTCEQELLSSCNGCVENLWKKACGKQLAGEATDTCYCFRLCGFLQSQLSFRRKRLACLRSSIGSYPYVL